MPFFPNELSDFKRTKTKQYLVIFKLFMYDGKLTYKKKW